MKLFAAAALVLISHHVAESFVHPTTISASSTLSSTAEPLVEISTDAGEEQKKKKRQQLKQALLGRIGSPSSNNFVSDPLLVDPLTKEPLSLSLKGPILGSNAGVRLTLKSATDSERVFEGRSDAYINLLEPISDDKEEKTSVASSPILSSLLTLTPPPVRSLVANVSSNSDLEYIPMRDLFTSPSVSYAYERGWRQGFAAAGFPGADKEFELAKEYFAPVIAKRRSSGEDKVVVDMSCATGLFTRRFLKSGEYDRVIACDYSDSMLTEARRRIRTDSELASSNKKLDLVRCDVAKIPLKSGSIHAFHAGAAMHCWPEIELSLKEIHRVLAPGGRYFATTFLGTYFQNVANLEKTSNGGNNVEQSMQAFQYFPNVEHLRDLLLDAGFDGDKVEVEAVGSACVIIRCEK
jgi:ubiquinone/menaquinone biosynthesis C-methylase UbiE